MPKARMETAGGEDKILDEATLRKLKQHNRSIYQQKKQDAAALRQKLQQWKEEKKMKMQEEKQRNEQKRTFVTIVKPAQGKPPPLPQTKPPITHKPVSRPAKAPPKVPAKGEQRKALASTIKNELTKSLASTSKCQQTKPLSKMPAKCEQKVVSKATKCEPVRKPVRTIASKVKQYISRPQASVRRVKTGQKENQQPAGSVSGRPSTSSKTTGNASHSVAPTSRTGHSSEMTTPLSGNAKGFGKRHIIFDLTKGEEEGRHLSLAEELQAAACVPQPAVSECTNSAGPQPSVDGNGTLDLTGHFNENTKSEFCKETTSASQTRTKARGAARDSLTSRFRKQKNESKHQSNSVKGLSQHLPRLSVVKNKSRQSIHAGKSTISTPPRSILKRKTCTFGFQSSEVLLSAHQPFHAKVTITSNMKDKPASHKRDSVEKNCEESQETAAASSGHVAFAVDAGNARDERTSYRKTPGRDKSQEFMRIKLDEWLEAKGRTPTSLRHAGCFHGSKGGSRWLTPRSQIKASMSVEQLSRQESALTKEDTMSIRRRMDFTDTNSPSISRRSTPARSSVMAGTDRLSQNSTKTKTTKRKSVNQTNEETVEMENRGHVDVGYDNSKEMEYGSSEDTIEMEPSSPRTSLSPREDSLSPRKTVEEVGPSFQTGSMQQLDGDYQKCLTALQSGAIDAESALQWLDMVSEANCEALHHAAWYKCRVAAFKLVADKDTLLSVFEQAIINNAQPAEEMAQLLTSTMRELLSGQKMKRRRRSRNTSSAKHTPGSSRVSQSCVQLVSLPEVQMENVFKSTTVKYSVTEVTPFKKRRRATDTGERTVPVITPVRRSTRLSASTCASEGRLPPGTPHVAEYSALEEVPSAEKEHMLFQPNQALESLMMDVSPEVERFASPEESRDVEDITE